MGSPGLVECRPAEPQQLALLRDAWIRRGAADHCAFLLEAHFLSPLDKRSFSTTNLPILACNSLTPTSEGPLCLPPEENIRHGWCNSGREHWRWWLVCRRQDILGDAVHNHFTQVSMNKLGSGQFCLSRIELL